MILLILGLLATASASPASDNKDTYKDQYRRSGGRTKEISSGEGNCTDPRTMRKHAAYTEWADAYSCTRHRCQPGGRNLAIYTVGCKRVEAPESAIECEEVVEDTNMQFPFCCTRLRCLVVVRGEVWTRVLGQPWEVLPAAPWSHMYKMKKPPPSDTTFLPKINEQGPIYELSEPETDNGHDKVLRSAKKPATDSPDCNEVVPRAAAPPDIVIALSTTNDVKEHKKSETRRSQINPENSRHKRARKTTPSANQYFEEDRERERERENRHPIEPEIQEIEESLLSTEKPIEASEERFYANTYGITQKPTFKNAHHQVAWTEIPQNQWNEHESMDLENRVSEPNYHQPEVQAQEVADKSSPNSISNKEEKPSNLQALVDAIGTRMRDIESVVQRMSEKVHQVKPPAGTGGGEASGEKRRSFLTNDDAPPKKSSHVHGRGRCSHSGKSSKNRRPSSEAEGPHYPYKSDTKRPNSIADDYKRFSMRNKGSKYLHSTDSTTDVPLFIEDNNPNGYFSDASNSVLRRSNPPKEPPLTYMAPVENRRKAPAHIAVVSDNSDDAEKKRKKHSHKKRRNKNGHHSKKHHASKDDKRKHFNRLSSVEMDKNAVSLEDSSAIANK